MLTEERHLEGSPLHEAFRCLFRQFDAFQWGFKKGEHRVGQASIKYLGLTREGVQVAEVVEFRGDLVLGEPADQIVASRTARMAFSVVGVPAWYHSKGHGGEVSLTHLGSSRPLDGRVLVTLPNGQRFVKHVEHLAFFYEEFFPIQEWLAVALDLSWPKSGGPFGMSTCFSVSLLKGLPFGYHALAERPTVVRTSFGQEITLDGFIADEIRI